MKDRESTKLGPYRLIRRLAHGGMSDVYLVMDERDEHVYALKMVRQRDEEDCQRFQQEVRVLTRLKHPHILPIVDYGSQEDICYYVMPYMAHGTVKERLEKGPLGEKEAGEILTQVADALYFLHEAGLVHRDVKPSNMLQDETNHTWLADFGLVRELEGGSDLTKTGYLIGTPFYMAPELADTQASVSSDIYALGVVLYEMLTGQLPFTGRTPLDICWKHAYEQPALPSSINPLLSPLIEQVVLHALEKNPLDRYSSAQALTDAYREALLAENSTSAALRHSENADNGMPISPPVKALTGQSQGRVRRMPLALVALAAMVLLTLSLISMGVASHNGISFLSSSPAQALSVHQVKGSPTFTLTPSLRKTTPTPVSPTTSGNVSSAGVGAKTPAPSATAGSTPPSATNPPAPAPAGSTPPPPPATSTPTPVAAATPISTPPPTPTGKPSKKKPHKPHG